MYYFFPRKKCSQSLHTIHSPLYAWIQAYMQAYIGLAKVVDKPTLFGSPFGRLRERSFVNYRLMLSGKDLVHSDETLLSIVIEMGGKVLQFLAETRKVDSR
jgi:hypothetical protein